MPRYSDAELAELKQSVDLVGLIQSRGIKLERHGSKDLKGRCPFHDDNNPSLIVTPRRNLWHCPACGKGGDVIRFVQEHDGVSFRHAVELLRNGHVMPAGKAKVATVRQLEAPVELDAGDREQLARVIDYYHQRLLQTEPARNYLEKRGIADAEAIKTFKLGYADRTLGLRIPQKNRQVGGELRTQLQKIGIIRDTGHEHLNGCLVIPVIDRNGIVTEVYGRKVTRELRKGTPRHMYLPGPHRGIWNPACLAASEVILCESLIDALTFWVNGFRNVTASYGTGGFTDDHLAAFIEHRVGTVYVAYDRDGAGDTGAAKVAEILAGEGIACKRVKFPHEHDANSYALNVTPADRSLQLLLEASEPMTPVAAADSAHYAKPKSSPAAPPATSAGSADVQEPTALPTASAPQIPCEIRGEDVHISLADRSYRVRGLARNTSFDILKVNIRAGHNDAFHVDTLDLYNARHRKAFVCTAAEELGLDPNVVKRDVGRVLVKLEELQEQNLAEVFEPQHDEVELSDQEKAEAFELLRSPQLLDKIAADFELAGLVGEQANVLVAYLAAVSRLTDDPLAVIIQSSSSAGKSSVLDAVLSFMPDETTVRYTAMTGQSLFYMGETELAHKILAISEEEGAEQAGYALKILQSEKRLKIASTGKDPKTGRLVTQEYVVEGPCVIFLTTTSIEIDEELQNRCLVLTVNEERDQTRRIHALQRQARTLAGLLRREDRRDVLRVHRNAQRLLRPLLVVNPFADRLTFCDHGLRTRRDHMKYLNLINVVALLHQHQREVRTVEHQGRKLEYIEVTLKDIAAANELAAQVMGVSLDELPPQTRKLLLALHQFVTEHSTEREIEPADFRFSRRGIREHTGWTNTRLRLHLQRLIDMEYLAAYPSGRGRGLQYELLYNGEGKHGGRFIMQLVDPSELHHYDDASAGANGLSAGQVHGECTPSAPHVHAAGAGASPVIATVPAEKSAESAKSHNRTPRPQSSYVHTEQAS